MTYRSGADAAFTVFATAGDQDVMPSFDIDCLELLQLPIAQVRGDLVVDLVRDTVPPSCD